MTEKFIMYREEGKLIGEFAPLSDLNGAYNRPETVVNGKVVKKENIVTIYKGNNSGRGRNLIVKRDNLTGKITCAESEDKTERYQPQLRDYANKLVSDDELIQYFKLVNWNVIDNQS